jgi:DNA-binding GntR family transcriptional regulator
MSTVMLVSQSGRALEDERVSMLEGSEMEVAFLPRRAITTKADVVFYGVREQLISGRRGYGEDLNTNEVAEDFGVSRRPVMDAFMRLEVAGFIEIIPQVGCRVIVPERRTVREHFYAAGVLDGAAARLAATRDCKPERRLLQEALRESRSAARALDQRRFELANKQFHSALLAAGGNRRVAERSHREHEAIADAIEQGDPAAAREAAESHLSRFGDMAILPGDGPVK